MASMDEVKAILRQMTCLLHYSKSKISRICKLDHDSMGFPADRRA